MQAYWVQWRFLGNSTLSENPKIKFYWKDWCYCQLDSWLLARRLLSLIEIHLASIFPCLHRHFLYKFSMSGCSSFLVSLRSLEVRPISLNWHPSCRFRGAEERRTHPQWTLRGTLCLFLWFSSEYSTVSETQRHRRYVDCCRFFAHQFDW